MLIVEMLNLAKLKKVLIKYILRIIISDQSSIMRRFEKVMLMFLKEILDVQLIPHLM